jgi:hypothetical protein
MKPLTPRISTRVRRYLTTLFAAKQARAFHQAKFAGQLRATQVQAFIAALTGT